MTTFLLLPKYYLCLTVTHRSWTTLTLELQRSTAVDQTVMALKRHDNPDVRALSETISSAWATQVDLELKRQAAASKRGRKFTGTGAAGCGMLAAPSRRRNMCVFTV